MRIVTFKSQESQQISIKRLIYNKNKRKEREKKFMLRAAQSDQFNKDEHELEHDDNPLSMRVSLFPALYLVASPSFHYFAKEQFHAKTTE